MTKSSYLEHSNPTFCELGIFKIFDMYKNIITYIPKVTVYRTRNDR